MEPFIFISYGLTKSGSTLAFQLTSVALEQAGCPQARLDLPGVIVAPKINAMEHVCEAGAEALWRAVSALGHPLVLKTHTRPDPALVRLVKDGRARVHVVLRDPRDIALSMLDNGRKSRAKGRPAFSEFHRLEDTFKGLDNQIETLSAWAALPGARIQTYDRLAFDTEFAARDILDHLGLPGDPAAIAAEVRQTRFTQFNKGLRDRHKTEMDAADSARFLDRYADFYRTHLPSATVDNSVHSA